MDEVHRMVALTDSVHADWLLETLETMPESERNKVATTTAKQSSKAKTGPLLDKALEDHWRPKTNIDLASKAQCSPGTITGLIKDGFDIRNKTAAKICEAVGIDFRALCQKHQIVVIGSTLQSGTANRAKLLEAAEKLIGTDQEASALDYLQFALSKAKR